MTTPRSRLRSLLTGGAPRHRHEPGITQGALRAFITLTVIMLGLTTAVIFLYAAHSQRDMRRDCRIVAAAAAGARDPVPLHRLARDLGCR